MTSRSTTSVASATNLEQHNGVPLSDHSLIAQICQRDVQALGLLYDRYSRLVYTIALRITQDRPSAEEVVQNVFQTAWQSAGGFQISGSVSTWLIAITRHRAIDATCVRGYRLHARAAVLDDAQVSHTSEQTDGCADTLTVRAALRVLPAKQRESIELAYYGGLTRAEIAARLGESPGTVSSRVRTGLSTLRAWLRDGAEDSG